MAGGGTKEREAAEAAERVLRELGAALAREGGARRPACTYRL